jgi:asparagine synthetase B (glutamine-hydrolysing)
MAQQIRSPAGASGVDALTPPERIKLPRFVVDWRVAGGGDGAGSRLNVSAELHAPLVRQERGALCAIVLGSAISGERVDPKAVCERLLAHGDAGQVARTLNGQFLLILGDRSTGRLQIANDRFTSFPVYWAPRPDGLTASLLYDDLVGEIRKDRDFAWQPEAMVEFIWFQKLLHTKTYDNKSRFLPAATVLTHEEGQTTVAAYWRPDFAKEQYGSEAEASERFGSLLLQSIRRKTSDRGEGRRFGHFLSGGHDSRSVLAAMPEKPHCFTVSFSNNYEVACARRAAETAGAPFSFIQLPRDLFVRYQDVMSRLCGGMYATDHALFLGMEDQVQAAADVVLHGHGFDYMYQGMYLPARVVSLFGSPTFFKRLQPFTGDIVGRFANGISFGMLDPEARGLIRDDQRERVDAFIRSSVEEVLRSGEDACHSDADRWEYLIVHALARHYSHPNVMSKSTLVEQRTPSFDNDLFGFYLGLPNEYRLSAQMLRHVLNTVDPRLGRIPTGNLGLPAGASPAEKTAWLIGRKLLRHATGIQKFSPPTAEDRTWPDRDRYIRSEGNYLKMIMKAVNSEILADTLPLLDWPRVRRQAEQWLAQPSGGGKFLVSLLTLHGFLTRHS